MKSYNCDLHYLNPVSNEFSALVADGEHGYQIVFKRPEVEAALAAKDRDLADANHMLLAANASAEAFRRVAEQRQGEIERLRRAVEWIKSHSLAYTDGQDIQWWVVHDGTKQVSQIPADLTDIIIKPTTGASNG